MIPIQDTADRRSARTAPAGALDIAARILDGLPAPALLLDGDGRVVLANAGSVHLIGYAQSELIGRAAEEFLSGESREPIHRALHDSPRTTSRSPAEALRQLTVSAPRRWPYGAGGPPKPARARRPPLLAVRVRKRGCTLVSRGARAQRGSAQRGTAHRQGRQLDVGRRERLAVVVRRAIPHAADRSASPRTPVRSFLRAPAPRRPRNHAYR